MILVTGGTGFIGSNIAAALCDAGHSVAISDVLDSDERRRNVAKRALAARFDPDGLTIFLDDRGTELDAIVHMGAITSTTASDRSLLQATNVELPQRLWRWCAESGVPFIFASSAAVYGDGRLGFADSESPEALSALTPLNLYGQSKLTFDRWAVEQAVTGAATPPHWYGLRFFNVYGPNEYHKGPMRSMVAKSYATAAAGRPVTLFRSHDPRYPDGGQQRDFVYIDDCVDVVRWLLEAAPVRGLYNVGTGRAQSWLQLMDALYTAAGTELEVEWIDTPETIRAHYQYHTEADLSKLRAAGYTRTFRSVEVGVEEYVSRYLSTADPHR